MRIFKSYTKKGVQISYLELEHKYLIKFEADHSEITLKFRKGPGLETHAELAKFEEEFVFDKVEKTLLNVRQDRSDVLNQYFNKEFEFEEII